jgi:hypothetical protein
MNRIYFGDRSSAVRGFQVPRGKACECRWIFKDDRSRENYEKLSSNLPANAQMRDEIFDEKQIDPYAKCKGLIYTPVDEDFDKIPSGASCNLAVAVNESGIKETVNKARHNCL